MPTSLKHKKEDHASVHQDADLTVAACATEQQVWHQQPRVDREPGYGERVAAVGIPWADELTCDAILGMGPGGGVVVCAEIDSSPSHGMWRCEEAAEFQVVFGPRTNPEGGIGVRLRCLDCAESAVATFGLGQIRLLAL